MISKSNVRCYVVPSRCDKNLVTYARDMSAAIKEATLPGLLEQIIRGVAYLHRAGRTHGNINPSDICVNSNKLRKSTISIVISATSESLHYSIINSSKRQSRPRALTDEIAMLKKDTYGIGTSIYRVVSASSVYWTPNAQKLPDEFYHNNGLSRIPARIAIPFAKAILRPLISRMKELMEPNIEKRPTPQQYLKRFSYTPPLSMTST
ncbi:hypothetical protein BDF22DRAFT_110440 [Syncephalis plumigaleata]|nr:hypothetical protein BDF22DRAFT_110440 [Syncephalis plumigaleata]